MKTLPPASIILATIWLAVAVSYAMFVHASRALGGVTDTPVWSYIFVVLGTANLAALTGFWFMRGWSVRVYYTSTLLSLVVGTVFYVSTAQSWDIAARLSGAFAGKNISGLLIFTIAFLPYRKEFRKRTFQEVSADAASAESAAHEG